MPNDSSCPRKKHKTTGWDYDSNNPVAKLYRCITKAFTRVPSVWVYHIFAGDWKIPAIQAVPDFDGHSERR